MKRLPAPDPNIKAQQSSRLRRASRCKNLRGHKFTAELPNLLRHMWQHRSWRTLTQFVLQLTSEQSGKTGVHRQSTVGAAEEKKKDDMTSCLLSIRLNRCFPAASASFRRLSVTLSADSLATRFIESLIYHRLNLLQGAVCFICKTE